MVLVAIAVFIVYTFILLLKRTTCASGRGGSNSGKNIVENTGRIDSISKTWTASNEGRSDFHHSSPEIDAKLAQATASRLPTHRKAKPTTGQKEDILAAYSTYVKAEAAVVCRKTFTRIQNLFNDGVVPEQNATRPKLK